jgi:hypothetical protein
MSTLEWSQLRDEFAWEGSWRDVSVSGTSIVDWKAGLSALEQSGFATRDDSQKQEASASNLREPFGDNLGQVVHFEVNGVELKCHFFVEGEIEFDLDPRQVTGQRQLDGLLAFMKSLATAVNKPVLLSPENMHESPFVRVSPDGECEYISSGGFFVEMARGGRAQ